MLGIPQQGQHAVADQIHGGFVAGDQQEGAHDHQLRLAQRVAALLDRHQGADEVRPWVAAPLGDDAAQVRVESIARHGHTLHELGRDQRVQARRHDGRPLLEFHAILGRHPQQFGDDHHGQWVGELSDQVDRAFLLAHSVEELPHHGHNARTQRLDHARGERLLDQRPEAGVVWRVGDEHRFGELVAVEEIDELCSVG